LQCPQRTLAFAAASSAAAKRKMVRHSGHWAYMGVDVGERADRLYVPAAGAARDLRPGAGVRRAETPHRLRGRT